MKKHRGQPKRLPAAEPSVATEQPKGWVWSFLERAKGSLLESLSDGAFDHIWGWMKTYRWRILISLPTIYIWFSDRGVKLASEILTPLPQSQLGMIPTLIVITGALLYMFGTGCYGIIHNDTQFGRVPLRLLALIENYKNTVKNELKYKFPGGLSPSARDILEKCEEDLGDQCTSLTTVNQNLRKAEATHFDEMIGVLTQCEDQINALNGIREQQLFTSYVRAFKVELQMLKQMNQDGLDILL